VARGAKLDLTVTLADPGKRGGAFTGSQGPHLQTLNEIVAISPILPAPRDVPPTGSWQALSYELSVQGSHSRFLLHL